MYTLFERTILCRIYANYIYRNIEILMKFQGCRLKTEYRKLRSYSKHQIRDSPKSAQTITQFLYFPHSMNFLTKKDNNNNKNNLQMKYSQHDWKIR